MKYLFYCIVLIISSFFLRCVVFAQSSDTLFDEYDKDADNQLTLDEFKSYYDGVIVSRCPAFVERMKNVFDQEDENGDGFISVDESEFTIRRFSSNNRTANLVVDGKVSKDDFIKCPTFTVEQVFEDFDQDKDNIVSKHEWDLRKRVGYKQ